MRLLDLTQSSDDVVAACVGRLSPLKVLGQLSLLRLQAPRHVADLIQLRLNAPQRDQSIGTRPVRLYGRVELRTQT